MRQPFNERHWTDHNDNPAGGSSYGPGFAISWQNGPLKDSATGERPENAENGAFVETLLEAVYGRIAFYEEASGGKFSCEANRTAQHHILEALDALDSRTREREARGVEGTHAR